MPNSRDIKQRIQSVKSTQQITKVMKVVSAAKLHKAQAAAFAARPYSLKLAQVIGRIMDCPQDEQNPLMAQRPCRRAAIILMTGNRGLAGGFNGNLIRLALETAETKYKGCPVDFIPFGSKGRDFLRNRGKPMPAEFIKISDVPLFAETKPVAVHAMEGFLAGTYDAVDIVYQAFLSPGHQEPRVRPLLPLVFDRQPKEKPGHGKTLDYLYEPDAAGVLQVLIPKYINNLVFQAALETKAGEYVARLMAMGAATDNAEKMISALVLSYNRSRQAAITKELSEIMGGAAALEQLEKEAEAEEEEEKTVTEAS